MLNEIVEVAAQVVDSTPDLYGDRAAYLDPLCQETWRYSQVLRSFFAVQQIVSRHVYPNRLKCLSECAITPGGRQAQILTVPYNASNRAIIPRILSKSAPRHARQDTAMASKIPNTQARKDKNSLPDRTPRRIVADGETQQALTQLADTLDAVLKYLNNVLGASK